MSTILAVCKGGTTILACDSVVSTGSIRAVGAVRRKSIKVGRSVIGIAGLTVYGVILEHFVRGMKRAPRLGSEVEIFDFFVRFVQAMKSKYHFVNDQCESDDPTPFTDLDAEFLIANDAGMFIVKQILSVTRFERFCAIGSGSPHAEGALHVLFDLDLSARRIAERAMTAAVEFDRASGGEIEYFEFGKARRSRPAAAKPRKRRA